MRVYAALFASHILIAANLAPSAFVNLAATDNVVAADSSGNFYTAGVANSHILVVKTDLSGRVLYSRTFGSSGYDGPSAIAVDATGAAYITGYTTAPDFPVVNGYLTKGNLFLTKLSPDGSTIVYSTFIATQGGAIAVAVDASGSAYVTGDSTWPGFTTTPGAFMTSADVPMYQQSVFVVKVAPDGSGPVWATFIAGKGIACATLPGVTCPVHTPGNAFIPAEYDTGRAIAVDPAGNVYIAGSTNSATFPITPGVVQPQYLDPHGTAYHGFISKLSSDGSSLLYSTYIATRNGVQLTALAVDSQGNAIAGGQAGGGFPVTPGALPLTPITGGLLVKLDPQASSFVYATYTGPGTVLGIATDTAGNTYTTGAFVEGSIPVTEGALSLSGRADGLLEFDPSGSLLYVTELPAAGPIAGAAGSIGMLAGNVLSIFQPADPLQPSAYAIQNAGSGAVTAQVAPGELVWLSAVNVASVTFDGIEAPILPIPVQGQLLVQVPFELSGQTVTNMRIGGEQTFPLPVTPVDPAIFNAPQTPFTTPLNSDGTFNSVGNPAPLGSMMTLFLTGAGPWAASLGTGATAPLAPLASPQFQVSVQVFSGNQPLHQATVLYAGSAPTQSDGVMQINFILPIAPDLMFNDSAFVTVQVGTTKSPPVIVEVTH